MFLIVVVALALALTGLMWLLVHSAPTVLSMVLPRKFTYCFGVGMLLIAIFAAFCAAYVLRDAGAMLGCFVQGYVGLWFMLATSSNARGSEVDRQMMKRLFLMLGILIGVMIAALYAPNTQMLAVLNLTLVTAGFWVTTNYLRFLDRGR